MIVTIKNKKQVNEFYKNSDKRFNSPRFKNGKDVLMPWYNAHGILQTGLTEEDEERLGKSTGHDLSRLSSFWHDYSITITDKDLVLHTQYPEDELKYLVLKAHFRVANGARDTSKPLADYVIYNELEEAKKDTETASKRIKAYALYAKLSMAKKREILKLYPGYSRTDNVEDEIIEANLIKELDRNYDKFVRLVEDKELDNKIFLTDLLNAKILTKNKNMYKYGEDVIGHSEDSAIEHLNDPKNQGLKIALMKELQEIKK